MLLPSSHRLYNVLGTNKKNLCNLQEVNDKTTTLYTAVDCQNNLVTLIKYTIGTTRLLDHGLSQIQRYMYCSSVYRITGHDMIIKHLINLVVFDLFMKHPICYLPMNSNTTHISGLRESIS